MRVCVYCTALRRILHACDDNGGSVTFGTSMRSHNDYTWSSSAWREGPPLACQAKIRSAFCACLAQVPPVPAAAPHATGGPQKMLDRECRRELKGDSVLSCDLYFTVALPHNQQPQSRHSAAPPAAPAFTSASCRGTTRAHHTVSMQSATSSAAAAAASELTPGAVVALGGEPAGRNMQLPDVTVALAMQLGLSPTKLTPAPMMT